MRLRSFLAATCLLSAVVAACTTDYQEGKGDPLYGGPNALAGQRPPGVTSEVTSEAGTGTDPTASKPACVGAGGAMVDAGACTVSFAKDILSAFGVANCGTTNCHGGSTPRNEPGIEPSDPQSTWTKLQAFTISTGLPYIDPCTIDDTKSAMGCNMIAEGQPGACGVHMPSGAQLPADVVTKINTWLKCGSPDN